MAIFGTLVKKAGGGYPDLQDAPQYSLVDPAVQQRRTIQGNLAALPDETLLAQRTNLANLQGTQQLFNQAMPGYQNMARLTEDALMSYLRGEIPSGVSSSISRGTNARAFAGGYGGSGMSRNLEARDLGRTAVDLQRYGLEASQAYARNNPVLAATPRYAVGNSFLSPEFVTEFERRQQDALFNRNLLAAKLAERVDPFTAAWTGDVGGIADLVGSAALGYAGGATLGGMGMGAGAGNMLGGILGGGGSGSQAPTYDPWQSAFNFGYNQFRRPRQNPADWATGGGSGYG